MRSVARGSSFYRVARQPRSNLPPYGTYHVFNRGVEQREIFLDDADRRSFVSLLGLSARRFRWALDAYTLMGNHFHLIITAELDRLSRGMHGVSFRYAQAFNERHSRIGHLFQGRFGARSIEDETYFLDACAYVFDNPVRAGLCDDARHYPWSGGSVFGDESPA